MKKNFEDGFDFSGELLKNASHGRPSTSYRLTIDAAKEFAMLAQTPQGKEVRKYFIEAEKELRRVVNQQPQPSSELEILAQVANTLAGVANQALVLQAEVMRTKAEIVGLRDEHLDLCESVEDLRKKQGLLGHGQNITRDWLSELDQSRTEFERRLEYIESSVRDANYSRIEAAQLLQWFKEDSDKHVEELTTRAKVRRLVAAFSQAYSIDYAIVFNHLYREFRDRYHYDVKARCRKNKGSYLARLEQDGQIEDFYNLTVKILCLPSMHSPWNSEVISAMRRAKNELE